MASSVVITIESDLTQSELQSRLRIPAEKKYEGLRAIKNFLNGIPSASRAKISVQTGSGAPAAGTTGGTIVLATFANNDTIRIGNVTLTGKSSPTTEDHFEIDGSDTADAAALAACINAHSVLSKLLTATSDTATVTVRSLIPGVISDQINMAASANATVTQLSGSTGGAKEAVRTYALGL